MSDPRTCGFVYVATGAAYLPEALHSAATLRQHHPDLPICLVTDCPPAGLGPFTEIRRPVGPVEHKPIDKLLAYEAPYERIIFLDTDTHVLDDLTPIFRVLECFDLALLQDVNRGWNYELPDVPLAFSEFNTGVVAFRKSDATRQFFRDWHANYVSLRAELNLISDQPSFRRTLFHSPLRVAPLPSEFHFLGDYPNATLWKVRLIHGRGNYDRVEMQVNEMLGLRSYVPELGVFPAYRGRRHLFRNLLRFCGRAIRLLVSGGESVTAKHPSNWWLGEGRPVPRDGAPRT
ncbi:MAG: putative nucleotide-diphospho-sugar transferase [Limisphaerales bacterium]